MAQKEQQQTEVKETENQAAELIKKRIRFLKKKMVRLINKTKIEKYESENRETLNADQIEAISRKPEVQTTLKELEEVLQKVRLVEEEHALQLAKVRDEVIASEQAKDKEALKHVHKVNYALGMPLAQLIGKHDIHENEYECLRIAQDLLTKPQLAKSEAAFVREVGAFHQKLWSCSGDKVPKTKLTYKGLNSLIIKLLSPPPAVPKFGLFDSSSRIVEPVQDTEIQTNALPAVTANSKPVSKGKQISPKTAQPAEVKEGAKFVSDSKAEIPKSANIQDYATTAKAKVNGKPELSKKLQAPIGTSTDMKAGFATKMKLELKDSTIKLL